MLLIKNTIFLILYIAEFNLMFWNIVCSIQNPIYLFGLFKITYTYQRLMQFIFISQLRKNKNYKNSWIHKLYWYKIMRTKNCSF